MTGRKNQQFPLRDYTCGCIGASHLRSKLPLAGFFDAGGLSGDEMHFKRIAQNAHLRDAGRRGFEIVSPVQQSHAFRAMSAVPGEFERPVERRITTAHDHQVLAGESSGVGDAVRNLPVLVG